MYVLMCIYIEELSASMFKSVLVVTTLTFHSNDPRFWEKNHSKNIIKLAYG